MAITLNPGITSLGITAPVLGPWFSGTAPTLPLPDPAGDLSVPVSFAAATDWWAPATGTLSLYVTAAGRPPLALDALQDANGQWPFTTNRVVAWFRLLPEVEERLHALVGLLPAASSDAVTAAPTTLSTPSRARVRSLAIELPAAGPFTPATVLALVDDLPAGSDADRLAALGLALDAAGQVANGAVPMTWLRRPGGAAADRDRLLKGLTGEVKLWAFDHRGRAIDPGAVACWWSWLLHTGVGDDPATSANDLQLRAPDIAAADYPQQGGVPVVVPFDAGRTLHLVDAHEGPLAEPFIDGRLQQGSTAVTSPLLQVTDSTEAGPSLQFSAAPAAPAGSPAPPDNPVVDDAPRPRMALLPIGAYAATISAWPGGPVHAGLTRDFARVAVLDEELHLTGLRRRDSRTAVATPAERRAAAQNRPSTRIRVARIADAEGVLLPNAQAAADAMLALPRATGVSRWVMPVADLDAGGTPGTVARGPGLPGTPEHLPARLVPVADASVQVGEYRVVALVGGGETAAAAQTVLAEFNLGTGQAGTWLRAWPAGFDRVRAERVRLTGGAGKVGVDGLARLVFALPTGLVAPEGLMGMDVLAVQVDAAGALRARRRYGDCRFTRPAPLAGAPATALAGSWVVCEAGTTGSGALPAGSVPPGGHVVLLGSPAALVDRTALPATALDANCLRNRIRADTDLAMLTVPAFDAAPDRADAAGRPLPRTPATPGNPTGRLDTLLGGRLHRSSRGLVPGASAASQPFALLDRLEVAVATLPDTGPVAIIGGNPPVPWLLSPSSQFDQGFAGVPAGLETQGTGLRLSGPPAVAVAEFVRERTAGLAFAEVQALAEPLRSAVVQSEIALAAEAGSSVLPTATEGTDPGPVVAVLRTVARGLEGLPGVGEAAMADSRLFPFSRNATELAAWLDDQVPVAGGAGSALRARAGTQIDSITRALDRRLMTAAFGAREFLHALLAAIDRAQDLVYIETVGVDTSPVASDGEDLVAWQRLLDRLASRPGLRVLLCVPARPAPGTPRALWEVRNQGLLDAVDAVRDAHPDHVAVFSPGVGADRALRLASTSVVIDDAIAFTGTTHLTRRGLSWDSSLAAAVFDQRVANGRPVDVQSFRRRLMADRLGLPESRLPEDPAELLKAVRELDLRGSAKLSSRPIERPATAPGAGDVDIWNPDGSATGLTLAGLAARFAAVLALTGTEHAVSDG